MLFTGPFAATLSHCERKGDTPVTPSHGAHPSYRMGNLMVLPSSFHLERRAQASHAGEVENQKFTCFLNITMIFLVSLSFVLKDLVKESRGSHISEQPVRFVLLQPHGHLISLMISRLDFTCTSPLSLQPPLSSARRGWEPATAEQEQGSFVTGKFRANPTTWNKLNTSLPVRLSTSPIRCPYKAQSLCLKSWHFGFLTQWWAALGRISVLIT